MGTLVLLPSDAIQSKSEYQESVIVICSSNELLNVFTTVIETECSVPFLQFVAPVRKYNVTPKAFMNDI